jgi:hypothetical protein
MMIVLGFYFVTTVLKGLSWIFFSFFIFLFFLEPFFLLRRLIMLLWVWSMVTKYGLGFPDVGQFELEARNGI